VSKSHQPSLLHAPPHRPCTSVRIDRSTPALAQPHVSSPPSSASSSSLVSTPVELAEPLIHQYADRKAQPVSLQEMLQMGSRPAYLLTAAQWLWAELPVRLAKRLRDLEDLPFGLSKSVEVQSLMALYRASLTGALSIKCPQCSSDEVAFTEMIKGILARHQEIVVDLASGINGGFLRRNCSLTGVGGASLMSNRPANQLFLLQELLEKFNSARIGLRMLMAQHVALHTPQPNMVGVIEINCNPSRIVAQAVEDAQAACRTAYGYTVAPKVNINDVSAKEGGIKNFNYVSAHLRFMVFELLKNAMRATVEHARKKKAMAGGWKPDDGAIPRVELTAQDLPPIQVVIVDGPTDVTIKISDRGGGIKRSELPLVFTYTYSATQKSLSQAQQAAQLQQAQQTHQQHVAQAAAAAEDDTSCSTPPMPPSASTPATAAVASSSSDWQTGANYQPTLNTQRHNFVEAFGLPITRLYGSSHHARMECARQDNVWSSLGWIAHKLDLVVCLCICSALSRRRSATFLAQWTWYGCVSLHQSTR
jgi:pyruvate dehydrogenase kinase 2/3/4